MAHIDSISEKPNGKEVQKLKMRQQLLEAATSLFLSQGIEETSADNIAKKANAARRTFYNHFVSKRDCILAVARDRYQKYVFEITSSFDPNADPAVMIAISAKRIFRQISSDPFTKLLIDDPGLLVETLYLKKYQEIVSTGISKGRFNPSAPLSFLSNILLWSFVGMVIQTIKKSSPDDQKEDFENSWARYSLHNLGLEHTEIDQLLSEVSLMYPPNEPASPPGSKHK